MYLHAMTMNGNHFQRWLGARIGGGRNAVVDFDWGMHALLSALFGKGAAQPFRLMAPEKGNWSLFMHSKVSPEEMRDSAMTFGDPHMLETVDLETLRSKPLPEIAAGARVGFDLRVNPSVRRGAGRIEMDPVRAIAEARYDGDLRRMEADGFTRERVYADWLSDRLADAGEIETCRMVRLRRIDMVRSGQRKPGHEVILQGTLNVTDADPFNALFAQGIGREKAYGFGLLMLRPADPERDPGL
jgi:CRISPR system Cascade subunit CasE